MTSIQLSRVEELILKGASYGLQVEEIAQGLGLSPELIGKGIADIYSKLHSARSTQLKYLAAYEPSKRRTESYYPLQK